MTGVMLWGLMAVLAVSMTLHKRSAGAREHRVPVPVRDPLRRPGAGRGRR